METGYSRVSVEASKRKRFRGFVRVDDDTAILQTSTSFATQDEATATMAEAYAIMKRQFEKPGRMIRLLNRLGFR